VTDRALLDTNIFITGYRHPESAEGQVLAALRNRGAAVTLLLSLPLEDQIRRVGRRIGGKDWAGLILSRFWRDFDVGYMILPDNPIVTAQRLGPSIPNEDLLIFLTAMVGQASLFISGNRLFIREAASQQRLFNCLTPPEFLSNQRA
jgi:hypothetical protein